MSGQEPAPRLTHLDDAGRARVVDVSAKPVTVREARAEGRVRCSPEVLALIAEGGLPKGDALAVARIAGLQAAKRTPDLVPLAHPVAVHAVEVDVEVDATPGGEGVRIRSAVRTADRTGIEVEALTCVLVAALTFVDMVKAVDRRTVIEGVRVTAKSGGRSGDWSVDD
ncbi:cyclic pyranopterin monophosphate synthase MoaC [Kineococcus terrestris]|uniref:cyclic pyranopterin monophosphate synthase MoaC n=1 Tax=Kineococcus terrestris TaxID=2044856 RepID=UPI0034DB713E